MIHQLPGVLMGYKRQYCAGRLVSTFITQNGRTQIYSPTNTGPMLHPPANNRLELRYPIIPPISNVMNGRLDSAYINTGNSR
ncbi:hypothetical protein GDO78_019949 [Eleutherodactylus coqui]|uniref:Uncharacterized protein n=1 Tax=Eleutherodactylus coqui TaxID=57060 RepID=A0A8J6ECF2_ELECQ|nr:hypothetical protein GDO78_019949 [Eleutherodactylus coqui]